MTATLFALRMGRWGIAGFSFAAFALVFIQAVGFYQVAGHTPIERAAFGASMAALASQFVALFPAPLRPDTVGGYVEFRGIHAMSIVFAIWALAAATGFARGDEERGLVEATLATGLSRAALVATRFAAFAVALAVASASAAAGYIAGVASGGESTPLRGIVEDALLLLALGLACYGIALLVAQLAPARAATAAAGAVLLALFLLNSLSRVYDSLQSWRWLSPFRLYDLSQPLPPGGYFEGRGFAVRLGLGAVFAAAAAVAFWRRDIGGTLVRVPVPARRATFDFAAPALWAVPVLRGLWERRAGVLAWSVGLAAVAIVFVNLTRTVVNVLLTVPSLLPYLRIFVHQQLYPAVLGYTWLNVAQLLFAALAITYVARWSAEDGDGRLEMTLGQPLSRAAIVVERMAVLAATAAIAAGVSGAVLDVASHAQGIDLDPGRLIAACAMLVPFALVFAAGGALLAAWNPRAAVGLLGAFAFASYLDTELATIFKVPVWLQDLSAFKLYGTPLLTGVDARNVALMLLLAAAGVGSSILAMQRRDVGA